jgi:hypothetical protein
MLSLLDIITEFDVPQKYFIIIFFCRYVLVYSRVQVGKNVFPVRNGLKQGDALSHYFFFPNATTCLLWTSWSPLPVVAKV